MLHGRFQKDVPVSVLNYKTVDRNRPNRLTDRTHYTAVFRRLLPGGGGGFGGVGFGNGSTLARCERPVSSVVCVHLDPPPLIEGTDGSTPAPTPASSFSSPSSGAAGAGAASSNSGGDDWQGGWDSGDGGGGGDDDKEEVRLQWTRDLCGGNGTGNATGLWEHLDDVEESVLRYKVSEARQIEREKERGGGASEKGLRSLRGGKLVVGGLSFGFSRGGRRSLCAEWSGGLLYVRSASLLKYWLLFVRTARSTSGSSVLCARRPAGKAHNRASLSYKRTPLDKRA